MISSLYQYFCESSEDRLNKFRVIVSMLRAELQVLQRSSFSLTRLFDKALKQYKNQRNDYNLQKVIEKAKNLSIIYQKCDAYEKVSNAAFEIIHKWDFFEKNKKNKEIPALIDDALYTMHSYSNLIEQKEMLNWINKAPRPNAEIEYQNFIMINENNLDEFVSYYCQKNNFDPSNYY